MSLVASALRILIVAGVVSGAAVACSAATPPPSLRAGSSATADTSASAPAPASTATDGRPRWVAGAVPSGFPVSVDSTSTRDSLFAWSRGYVVFRETVDTSDDDNAGQIAVTPWVSSDGRSWQQGQPLDAASLWDSTSMAAMVEGPAGLVAVSRGSFFSDDLSGDVPDAVTGLWTSTDGKSWKRVALESAFGVEALGDVAAGPLGYIATNLSYAAASVAPAVWLSADGRKWRSVALARGSLAGGHLATGYVLPGGYLVAGWTVGPADTDAPTDTAGPNGPDTTPAIWSSSDGVSWRESSLPGVVAAPMKEAAVETIAAGRYIADVGSWSCGCEPIRDDQAWSSTDGFSWQPAPAASFGDVSDGHRGLRLVLKDGVAPLGVETSPDGLTWSPLAVSGPGPTDNGSAAYGPAGLMVEATDGWIWLLALG